MTVICGSLTYTTLFECTGWISVSVSCPDLREPLFSILVRVGILVYLFLGWLGMVPNQRQLSIVVSDWGSYLGSLFQPVWCGILFMYYCLCALHSVTFVFVLYCFGEFHELNMWNSMHAVPWSIYSLDDHDSLLNNQHVDVNALTVVYL